MLTENENTEEEHEPDEFDRPWKEKLWDVAVETFDLFIIRLRWWWLLLAVVVGLIFLVQWFFANHGLGLYYQNIEQEFRELP